MHIFVEPVTYTAVTMQNATQLHRPPVSMQVVSYSHVRPLVPQRHHALQYNHTASPCSCYCRAVTGWNLQRM